MTRKWHSRLVAKGRLTFEKGFFGKETLFSRYYNQQISGQGGTDILKVFTYAVFKSLFNSITIEFQICGCPGIFQDRLSKSYPGPSHGKISNSCHCLFRGKIFELVLLSFCPRRMKGLLSICPAEQENTVPLESLVRIDLPKYNDFNRQQTQMI